MSALAETLAFARRQARALADRRYDDPVPNFDAADRELDLLLTPPEARRVLGWYERLVEGGMDPEDESVALALRLGRVL